jgi:NADPH-dependent 2,4-dienoyl-CoA reductase/sulfur reductase-like enzyme
MDKMVSPPGKSMLVAVVGGGPAGLQAALVAAERGHQVTLYEKGDHLGGRLLAADVDPGMWPTKRFKDYLVNQVKKSGVKVVMNMAATPELIRNSGYEAVLVALGAVPDLPDIPGADGDSGRSPLSLAGMRPLRDEALRFYGSAGRFFVIGDCDSLGDVQTSIRSAFAAASQL